MATAQLDPTLSQSIGAYDEATGANDSTIDPWNGSNWSSGNATDALGSQANYESWAQGQYGYMPDYGPSANGNSTPLNAPTTSATPAAGGNNTGTVATAAPVSGGPANQINASALNGLAPLPVQDFGALPSVSPTYGQATTTQAATVNPMYNQAYLNQEESANAASLAPTFQTQDSNLQDSLAARGISSSGAAGDLSNQLAQSQGATLAGMNAAAIGQQAGYVQGDITQNQANRQATGEFNANELTGMSSTNAGIANTANTANENYYATALGSNESNYNNYLNELYSSGTGEANTLLTAYLNSYGPNTGVQSSINNLGTAANSIYGSVYGNAVGQQNASMGDAASMYGSYEAAAAAGG
jgi:hypothetical protein